MKALIVVTHLLGAGHLTRAAAIGRALAKAGHRVTLVSGGTPTMVIDFAGIELVQLPPVRGRVDDFSTLRDPAGTPIGADYLDARRALLLKAFRESQPDIVVTELFPFGRRALAGEFGALIDEAEVARPRPALVCSIRDILAPPGNPAKLESVRAWLHRYAAVLVHGDPALVPLEASWPVDEALRSKLAYTGYVGPAPGSLPAPGSGSEDGEILVSGGSSAAALPLYRTALEAARLDPGRRWRILVGEAVAESDSDALWQTAPVNAVVERARPDFLALLSKAPIFVGQAGYNTVMDIVATQARAVLVPFEAGRETEQRLRARALAERGFATVLPEAELSPASLLQAVAATSSRRWPVVRAPRLDGASATVRLLETLRGRATLARPDCVEPAW